MLSLRICLHDWLQTRFHCSISDPQTGLSLYGAFLVAVFRAAAVSQKGAICRPYMSFRHVHDVQYETLL